MGGPCWWEAWGPGPPGPPLNPGMSKTDITKTKHNPKKQTQNTAKQNLENYPGFTTLGQKTR